MHQYDIYNIKFLLLYYQQMYWFGKRLNTILMNAPSQIGARNKLICMRDCYRRCNINASHTCFMLVVQTHIMSPHATLRTSTALVIPEPSMVALWLDRTVHDIWPFGNSHTPKRKKETSHQIASSDDTYLSHPMMYLNIRFNAVYMTDPTIK